MRGEQFIKTFCESLGMDVELDENHTCSFEVEEFIVSFIDFPEYDLITLTGNLGEIPKDGTGALQRLMLEANYLFNATAGATLGIDRDNGYAMLCRTLSCQLMDDDSFYQAVETFISTCDLWYKTIHGYSEQLRSPVSTEHTRSNLNLEQAGMIPV